MGKKKRREIETLLERKDTKSKVRHIIASTCSTLPIKFCWYRTFRISVIDASCLTFSFSQEDGSSSIAEAQAKKKILKLTRKLQLPGVLPEKRARLLSKIEGSLSKLDSLPNKVVNGNTSGEPVCFDRKAPIAATVMRS